MSTSRNRVGFEISDMILSDRQHWSTGLRHTYAYDAFGRRIAKVVGGSEVVNADQSRDREGDELGDMEAASRGPTEAMCKNLTLRLKRTGMKWDTDNAAALMNLVALRESGQWESYWQTRKVA